jgi:hypothetical protein
MQASGHEVVSHAQVSGAHDDLATAAAGALVAAGSGYTYDTLYRAWDPDYRDADLPPPPASEAPPPLTCDGNWWRATQAQRQQQQTSSADDRLRSFYSSIDSAIQWGKIR